LHHAKKRWFCRLLISGHELDGEVYQSFRQYPAASNSDRLRELKSHGVETAINDFGNGYSSLNNLRRLPLEFLKIDKSLVSDADMAAESKAIIRAISAMVKSLGLKTIAGGVERPAQELILREMACEFGQGYPHAKPMAYGKLLEFRSSRALAETL